jgi:tetratricopeptide (TPR) repeat protein
MTRVACLVVLLVGGAADSPAAVGDTTLGALHFPVSCAPAVQDQFDRGVALLHHMMYVESRATFEDVAKTDPECAMAHWGIAMTLFQPLWPTRPDVEALTRGWTAIQRATVLAPSVSEQAFIAAAALFFKDPDSADYWTRIARFEEGMEAVYRSFPEHHEAAAFYALSHLASASQSDEPMAHHERAASILLDVHAAAPTHPGAIHYTIHANDVDGRQGESLDVVRSYADIAPSVPHALHMPTHIFVRLGAWEDVIEWNRRSADAALQFPAGDATSHHYPHALDYLVYAYLQRAEDDLAKTIVELTRSQERYQGTFIAAYHLAAIPARYYVERRQWAEAAALPDPAFPAMPWKKFPWPSSLTQFARGLGSARSGDLAGAAASVEKLDALRAEAEEAGEAYFAQQIEISRLAVSSWLAHGRGHTEQAVEQMRLAAQIENTTPKHPVTPGSLAPASELLGDLLLEMGQPVAALDAYETALTVWPNRFNTLLGASRAATAAGDRPRAARYTARLAELTGDAAARGKTARDAFVAP